MTIVMTMAMMFAFAGTAMAAGEPTLTILVNGKAIADNVTVEVGDSVYDAVVKAVGDRAVWKDVPSNIGDGTGKVLVSLDGNASEPYETDALIDYDDMYTPECGDEYLIKANEVLLTAFPASQGLGLWYGEGMGFGKTGNYGIYVGEDWMFTINGERPVDDNDKSIQLYMNQAIIEAGDKIVLTYEMVYEPFAM